MEPSSAGRSARLIAFCTPLALLGGAYIAQYGFGIPPCEMCWWQRYPHFAALLAGLVALIRPPGTVFVVLAALGLATSGLIGAFHAGIEYGWWEGVTACTAIPDLGGGDPMEAIFNAPLIRCDVAPWSLFGISLAGWNFLFSCLAAIAIFILLKMSMKANT